MNDYQGKKVAVLGLGIEGVDAVKYLVSQGADVTVLDQKSESQLASYLQEIPKIKFEKVFGENYLKNLGQYEIIFRSPGVKIYTPELIAAKKHGLTITSPTKEFFSKCKGKIIGVTGTKGKGTTATLIAGILETATIPVKLAGNIGTPMLTLLSSLSENDWVILELSSFQLQDLTQSPHIAVITNITVDHLDYHSSRQEYVEAKQNIIKFQTANDFAVINRDDPTSFDVSQLGQGKKYFYSLIPLKFNGTYIKSGKLIIQDKGRKTEVGLVSNLKLRGQHNWSNVAAAITASYLAGSDILSIQKSIYSFTGLEHRLELVAEINNIKFYNDSFGTTPQTAIAAIDSFTEPVILIAGGSEKGSDFSQLGEKIVNSNVKAVILIGQMSDRIHQAILKTGKFGGRIITGLNKMSAIIDTAQKIAAPGDVVLLSPACASFDMFKNYKERGNLFKHEVLKRIQ